MKIINLPDVLHEYLVHIIEAHSGRGIHPEECMAVSRLWDAVTNQVTTIPDSEIAKMATAATPSGQSDPTVTLSALPYNPTAEDPTIPKRPVECAACWDEYGSYACLRPAHPAYGNIGGV